MRGPVPLFHWSWAFWVARQRVLWPGSHQVKDQLAARRRRIDLLRQTDELNTTFLETLEQLDQMC